METCPFATLDQLDPKGKRILLRVDLNVPMKEGEVRDVTRLKAIAPTIKELADKGGRVILIGHLGSPKSRDDKHLSLKPVADKLADIIDRPVAFVHDCVGVQVEDAAFAMKDGDILMLENTRFHEGEKLKHPEFAKSLAKLGDVYVNDAFSVVHRDHASTSALAEFLPPFGGRLMQDELGALNRAMENPKRPLGAIVGGGKISTKLQLLGSLIEKVDVLFIAGAMSNTFFAAKGYNIGQSIWEPDMVDTAKMILKKAEDSRCRLLLPIDVTISEDFMAGAPATEVLATEIPSEWMALDIGPETVKVWSKELDHLKTLLWNGPLGVYELPPFDTGTGYMARHAADLTRRGQLITIAGGGDTASALRHAGVISQFTHVSTAGGAFLAWLEGKVMPGLDALSRMVEKTFSI